MLPVLWSSIGAVLAKIAGVAVGIGTVLVATSTVAGDTPHSILTTILNLLSAPAALAGAWLIRELKRKIETGDTPSAVDSAALRADMSALRADLRSLSDGMVDLAAVLVRRGDVAQLGRRIDDPPPTVADRPGRPNREDPAR